MGKSVTIRLSVSGSGETVNGAVEELKKKATDALGGIVTLNKLRLVRLVRDYHAFIQEGNEDTLIGAKNFVENHRFG